MARFWLNESGYQLSTFAGVSELIPHGYSSWNLKSRRGTMFATDDRLEISEIGNDTAQIRIIRVPTLQEVYSTVLFVRKLPLPVSGQSVGHYLSDASDSVFLMKWVHSKYDLLIQRYYVNGPDWRTHRPSLSGEIVRKAPAKAKLLAFRSEALAAMPTQEDEGGGYVP